ncbi:MAG: minor capsid protein [Alphaproteobacteria bacterium]|nr:minor capsid protein [Alphaproteobacteria bacterium]
MKNAEYWRNRFLILENSADSQGMEYIETLQREYETASRRLQAEMNAWYTRFATNNGITLTEAKRWLTSKQLDEFKWTVQDYIKYGESVNLNPQWMKQLENASARVHISRLESLQLQLQQQIEVLNGNQLDGMDNLLRGIYSNGYYHTAFEIQKGLNIGWDLQSLNEKQLSTLLSKPWSTDGQTFRDRCWKNKTELVNTVQTNLVQSIIRGDGPDRATKAIAEKFRVGKNKAARLVMTESAYFSSQAQQNCFNELGVEQFEIIETLDSHTCEICADLDGKVFPMKDFEPGVTAPPFHPWCRGCTAPYFEDNDGERAARDQEGKVYYVPASMKYNDWKKSFVDGDNKEGLTEIVKNNWGFSTIQGTHGPKDDVAVVNPNYTKGPEYRDNCTHCVAAYEMRRRGFDIEATPTVNRDPYKFGRWRKIFQNYNWNYTKATRKNKQASEIADSMLKWGDGARAEIRVEWDGGNSGHVFVAEVKDGKVLFLDPQNGKVDVENYFDSAKPSRVEFGRLDNLDVDESMIPDVCKKKG